MDSVPPRIYDAAIEESMFEYKNGDMTMETDIDMNSNSIKNMTIGSDIDMQNHSIKNLQNPVDNNDVVTKFFILPLMHQIKLEAITNATKRGVFQYSTYVNTGIDLTPYNIYVYYIDMYFSGNDLNKISYLGVQITSGQALVTSMYRFTTNKYVKITINKQFSTGIRLFRIHYSNEGSGRMKLHVQLIIN